jgi:uncharacterized membrane protein
MSVGVSARVRLLVSVLLGLGAGFASSLALRWVAALPIGFMVAAATYVAWMWLTIWPMDAQATQEHALREDPGRALMDLLGLITAVASLGAVAVLLTAQDADWQAALSVGTVVCGWAAVHTTFTTRYAQLYYGDKPGGIDFNQDERPRYSDFAYVAFSIGMTFQVSDTNLGNSTIRATALRHSLLSFVFGTVIIATMINLVAGLGH